jgi:O-antigen/teichoic acid export membrane protein
MVILQGWIDRLKRIFPQASFAKHVMVVSGSVVIGQAISILVGPINSRLYKPGDYGTLSIFGALFGVIGVIGTMQYEMAFGTIEDDSEAFHLLVLCLLLTGTWAALFMVLSLAAGNTLVHLFSKDDAQFARFLWYLPLGIAFYSLSSTFSRWAMRKRAFPELSASQITSSLSAAACTVSLGFLHAGFAGLVAGNLVYSLYQILKLSSLALPEYRAQIKGFTLDGLKAVARRHYRYPLYTTWSVLLNSLSIYTPIFLISKAFGNSATGHFSMSHRILFLPTLLISGAITPVFYSRAKQAQKEGKLANLTLRLIASISGVNAFFPVFMGLFGEQVFMLVFGSQWQRAGQYSAALAPLIFFSFLVYPLEALPLIFERQRTNFQFQVVQFAVRAGSLLLGIYLKSDLLSLWLYGCLSAVFMLVYFIWLFRLVDGPVRAVLAKLGKELGLALAGFGACRLIFWWSRGNLILTACFLLPTLVFFSVRGIRQILQGKQTPPGAPEPAVETPL